MSLSYITYQNLDLAKARSLFVQKAEQLLCLVNSHPKIQPFYMSAHLPIKISL
ncbi:MAG: hypothetical protein HWD61_06780 [Parachlamydiaceae bacterium]|nr:MAG: hypothetical protein HWD61_06780 [Parachlamydiaceae bacterium]